MLPKEAYFAPGRCGRVSHAIGVADSLAHGGTKVTVLSGPKAAEHLLHADVIEVETGENRSWHAAMFRALDELLDGSTETTAIIVRYGVSNSLRFVSRMWRHQPSIIWCYEVNSLGYHQYPLFPKLVRRLMLAVESRIVGQADCSYLISDVLRQDIEPRVPVTHRCLVVPNGGPAAVDLAPTGPESTFRFVFFGMLKGYNHLDVMIEGFSYACAEGLSAELHIHGDGPLLDQLKETAKQDPRIYVHGRYDYQSLLIEDLTASRCVLLLPFGDSEGLNRVQSPIKLFEYMSTGLPIIASDMPQIRLTLTNNKSAILVNPRSAVAWGKAMLKLKSSAQLRDSMSSELRKSYPAYTWDRRTAQLLEGLNKHFKSRASL